MIPTGVSEGGRGSLLVAIDRGEEFVGVDFVRRRRALLNFLQAKLKLGAGRRPFGVEDFVLQGADFVLDGLACTHVHHT